MLKLGFQPYACEFVEINELRLTYIYVTDSNSGTISVIDENIEEKDKVIKVLNFHTSSVRHLKFSRRLQLMVSIDQTGHMELWDPRTYDFPRNPALKYQSKLDTDFYLMKKAKASALGMALSNG